MVAVVNEGPNLRGAVEYNEEKVALGNAKILYAHLYPKDACDLSFKEKLFRLEHLAELTQKADNVCQHISIGFHPSENISKELLQQLAVEYMEKIGFGTQPFLLYQHVDTAIQHVHIVSTKIKEDGRAIDTSFIGIKKSIPATEQLEEKYGLMKAKEQKSNDCIAIKAADIGAIEYGEKPTKKEISRVVRSVISLYKFGSLSEFNSILRQYNVVADPGEEGSRLRKNNGLVYRVLKEGGEIVGKPIKSSSIYGGPTLSFLQRHFKQKSGKAEHKERLFRIIDEVLNKAVDEKRFLTALKEKGISAQIYKNKEGLPYGITFVDNVTLTVFKGSDIDKSYSAKGIFSRLQPDEDIPTVAWNKQFVNSAISNTDFKVGIKGVLFQWLGAGMRVQSISNEDANPIISMGYSEIQMDQYWKSDKRISNYLSANGLTARRINYINKHLPGITSKVLGSDTIKALSEYVNTQLSNLIDAAFDVVEDSGISYELLKEARKKKKYKRG
ncbi:relaxase/mobilization nuclease domain-containing protein [Chitinophaga silvisoli]|uniref:Relaxase n=1 Tax=Chitinophaga silvisoli TaxID=2291814 RepID=A0A3E1P2P2_9BACT|nr:relaxase/mobilization nuclease domain-containing protein [Chitinophaga silvisoli]RFM34437.1 relaxase [Chitinophaga silvisoli]